MSELEALSRAGASIVSSTRDVDDLYELIYEECRHLIDTNTFQVGRFEGHEYHIKVWIVNGKRQAATRFDLSENAGIVGWVRDQKKSLLVQDFQNEIETLPAKPRYVSEHPPRSAIFIPLINGQRVLGILAAQSQEAAQFTKDDERILTIIANQASAGIANAHLFQRQQEQAWLTNAQLQVAKIINRSHQIPTLLKRIAALIPILTSVKSCTFLIWDDELQVYTHAANSDTTNKELHENFTLRPKTWPPLTAAFIGQIPYSTKLPPPWDNQTLPATLYPLLSKSGHLGVMVIHPLQSPVQQELLQNICEQTALELESLQLVQAQQEEAWVNTALLQVAEAVNSVTHIEAIMENIVRLVHILTGVSFCIALEYDEGHEVFSTTVSYGLSENGLKLSLDLEIERESIKVSAAREEGLFKPAPTYYEISLSPELCTAFETKTVNAFPLVNHRKLVGALLIGPAINNRPLGKRRLSIIAGIAQQAAIALENNQLHHEAAARERLEQEVKLALGIQESLIPDSSPGIPGLQIASTWLAARQVSGDFYDFFELRDGRWGIVVADVADKGMPAAIFMAVSRTILRGVAYNRQNPADILERANELLFKDTHSDLFVTLFYAIWDAEKSKLYYASGGHNPALHFNHSGEETQLQTKGIALSVLENISIEDKAINLAENDIVVIYTDGITEAIDVDNQEFGLDKLSAVIVANRKRDAAGISAAILNAVQQHTGQQAQFDDMTLVVLKKS